MWLQKRESEGFAGADEDSRFNDSTVNSSTSSPPRGRDEY